MAPRSETLRLMTPFARTPDVPAIRNGRPAPEPAAPPPLRSAALPLSLLEAQPDADVKAQRRRRIRTR
jgi:hypothetical protein